MEQNLRLCVVCEIPIDKTNWEKIKRIHKRMLSQVDECGESSLSEHQQVLYNNEVHVECYHLLS